MTDTAQVHSSRELERRYRRIVRFGARVLAQAFWFELVLPRLGLGKLAARGRIRRLRKAAERFRVLALELTGLMIKVGQFLSSRLDVLPAEITKALEGLQDEVDPEPFAAIVRQVEQQLGMPLTSAFAEFDERAIAAASLGQVHVARLSTGLASQVGYDEVVVKVLRPGIEEIVEVDLAALRKIGGWLSRVKLVSRRADAPALVEEFAETTYEEIDYIHEAANLERFAADFAADPYVGAPNIIWERTAKKVLTLEKINAAKITDIAALTETGLDPNAVAAELARVVFQQIFVNRFFHADPHPGNIFVAKTEPGSATPFVLKFIDFGMMGEVTAEQQRHLQRFIIAVATRDARGWVESVEALRLLLPSADTYELELAIEALFKRFGGVAVTELVQTDPRELRDFALQFSDLVRSLPFQMPENFLLLARSISIVSGVTSSLNRSFNLWDALDPFARALMQGAGSSTLRDLGQSALETLTSLARLPQKLDQLVSKIDRGNLNIGNPGLERRVRKIEGGQRRLGSAIYFAALLGGGLYLRSAGDPLANWLLAASVLPIFAGMLRRRP